MSMQDKFEISTIVGGIMTYFGSLAFDVHSIVTVGIGIATILYTLVKTLNIWVDIKIKKSKLKNKK
ncbi:MAG: hypothetical protein HRU29_01840 [Rhizobiales bacterium]|nr:hypothetical protein [Hyphomicrobiales bacterium]NRB13117.1 hypothetical protein [Hyphomicrobiales bacterium]